MKSKTKLLAKAISAILLISALLWFPKPVRGFVLSIFVSFGGPETRSRYVMHIEHLGPAGVPALMSLCAHEDFETRLKVLDSLGVIGPEAQSAVEKIAAALDSDPEPAVRRRAAWALARISNNRASAILAERFSKKLNKDEALAAVEGLTKSPEPALLTVLLEKLSQEPETEAERNELWDLRSAICEKLKTWGIKTTEVMTALETASKGQDSDVAEAARSVWESLKLNEMKE